MRHAAPLLRRVSGRLPQQLYISQDEDGHDIPPLKTMMMHLMTKRTEAEVWLPDKLDVTELLKYVEKKKAANPNLKITPFQCVIAALARMAKERPLTNCFVQGRRMYERNRITIGFGQTVNSN